MPLLLQGKGLDQIIRTLQYLQEYVFIIIGEGPNIKELKSLSQKNYVYQIGLYFFSYQKNPCNYLPYFDVYVMPLILRRIWISNGRSCFG